MNVYNLDAPTCYSHFTAGRGLRRLRGIAHEVAARDKYPGRNAGHSLDKIPAIRHGLLLMTRAL
jgi:hypothetical protein